MDLTGFVAVCPASRYRSGVQVEGSTPCLLSIFIRFTSVWSAVMVRFILTKLW
jgi:hypothetical protein